MIKSLRELLECQAPGDGMVTQALGYPIAFGIRDERRGGLGDRTAGIHCRGVLRIRPAAVGARLC